MLLENDADASTRSNHKEIQPTNLLLWEVEVDFSSRTLRATATYAFTKKVSSVKHIYLDTRGLSIENIEFHKNGKGKEISGWVLDQEIPQKAHLGQRLVIPLPPTNDEEVMISIQYQTSPTNCTASQWLPPNQTSGKKHPYFFTQCQAIHARSLIPCMDCPAVKFTYCAMVTVPSWATPVMSGLLQKVVGNVHHWEQPVPIPSYLLALAVGDLESRDLSNRVRIWSEPSMVQSAAWEFDDTETFISIAESITDMPYPWKRYDLLCLPPSFPVSTVHIITSSQLFLLLVPYILFNFPSFHWNAFKHTFVGKYLLFKQYGGMENPCLTFVTPTLLAGDRSLADVVAHEIAHSWTGNLVTNLTWGHFWLNEGWTTWLQRKIMVKRLDQPEFFDFDALSGWEHLKDDVNRIPSQASTLVWKMKDDDPDDWYSSIPYEKGFHLLYALERLVGSTPFLAFFRAYLKKYAYVTITSYEFQQFFNDFFKNQYEPEKDSKGIDLNDLESFDWNLWLHGEGMPPIENNIMDRTLSNSAEQLAKSWLQYNNGETDIVPSTSMEDWTSPQKVCFLDFLLSFLDSSSDTKTASLSTVQALKQQYHLDTTKNCELLLRFSLLAIQAQDKESYPTIIKFVTSQGRMKYVRPIYRALYASTDKTTKELATTTFQKYAEFYHPIASKLLITDLHLDEEESSSYCVVS